MTSWTTSMSTAARNAAAVGSCPQKGSEGQGRRRAMGDVWHCYGCGYEDELVRPGGPVECEECGEGVLVQHGKRLTDDELEEIRACDEAWGEPLPSAANQPKLSVTLLLDRRRLLRELEWMTAERDAWRTRYYRMAEALGKTERRDETAAKVER
jgi:hypothetical protein